MDKEIILEIETEDETSKSEVKEETEVTKENQEEDKKVLENSGENGTIKKAENKRSRPLERRRDRIPHVRTLPEVTVFGYRVNLFSFRYSITPPLHTEILWQKKMTGSEAYQFLTNVKAKNRQGKLESKALPDSK